MVRSKKKWKKEVEKLTQCIEKKLVQLRKKPVNEPQNSIKSPDSKKSKNSDIVPTDSSSDILPEKSLNTLNLPNITGMAPRE